MPRPLDSIVAALLVLSFPRAAVAQGGSAPTVARDFRAELFLAIEMNDLEATRQVLEEGAAPEINRGNPSPLTTAVVLDNLSMAAMLLRAGGDPDATEDSPLLAAIRTDSVNMMRLLFAAGATLRPDETRELLALALRGDDVRTIYRELLDHGAAVNLALRVAVENRELEAALYALERGGDVSSLGELDFLAQISVPRDRVSELLDLAVRDDNREAALSYFLDAAAAAGDLQLAQHVLDRGGDLTLAHLERAEAHGQDDVALLFLERMDEGLATLIERAEAEGRDELVVFLRELRRQRIVGLVAPAVAVVALFFVLAAVVFFVRKHAQRSPRRLFAAVVRGDLERIEELLGAGADANARHRGEPLLYVAARREDLKAARALLHHGADVNLPALTPAGGGDSRWTPLHAAAKSGNISLAELFLRHGARIDARSAAEKTPLDLAGAARRDEMVQLLLERGAVPLPAAEPGRGDAEGGATFGAPPVPPLPVLPPTAAPVPPPAAPVPPPAAPPMPPPATPVFETLIIPPPEPPDAPPATPVPPTTVPPTTVPPTAEPRQGPSFAPSVVPTRVIPRPAAGGKKDEPG